LIHAGLEDVRFVEYNELFKLIRFSFNDREISYRNLLESFIYTKVLVIDDFGMEVSGNLVWVLDNIGYIVNERYTANLPTIMTSNYWRPIPKEEGASLTDANEEPNPYAARSHEVGKILREQEARRREQNMDEAYWDRISYRLRSRIAEMCHEVLIEGFDYRKKQARNRDRLLQIAQEKRKREDH
jgi:hypothetical protein